MRSFALILIALAACESGSARPTTKPTEGAQAPSPSPSPAPVKPALDLSAAKELYGKLCAQCHGADAKGYAADNAPSLVNSTFLESASDEFIRRGIVFGRPGTSMGAYGKALGGPLDDAGVDLLVAYLRSMGPKPKAVPAPGAGDATRGEALYTQYCKSCHGDVKTRGEAPHLANPQFLTNATDGFIRYAITAGRPGTKMPGFTQQLDDQQINDVVAYVRTLGQGGGGSELLPAPTGKEPLVINPKGKAPAWKARDGRFVGVDAVAKALAEKRKMIIVDARPPSDWRRVHITGAVSIPYHDTKRLEDIVKQHPGVAVVAYCACPHHLSGIVVDELAKRGHKKAYVLDEGINLWHQKGYPVTAAPGVTAPAFEPHNHGHHGHGHEGGHGH